MQYWVGRDGQDRGRENSLSPVPRSQALFLAIWKNSRVSLGCKFPKIYIEGAVFP